MSSRKVFSVVALALIAGFSSLFVLGKPASGAGDLPVDFEQSRFVGGLRAPTTMTFAPDGRLFVSEQAGRLRVVKDGVLLEKPFVNISKKVDREGARGLLGIAFDPDFENNGFVYVYYTREARRDTPVHNRVSRFTADGDSAVAGSEKVILELDNLSFHHNHNGGAMSFGTDGKLYIAVGDNDKGANAQKLSNLKGKVLRINPDGTIPQDNPFYADERAEGRDKAIWTLGFRNPFSFAFQPGTGRLFINDVGEQAWEEINEGVKGANYGWPRYEGAESDPLYEDPVHAYRHGGSESTGCAITGGAFYDPATVLFPAEYVGDYFFADYCSGWIRRLDLDQGGTTDLFKASSNEAPIDLKTGDDGALYFLARGTGSVERIQYNG